MVNKSNKGGLDMESYNYLSSFNKKVEITPLFLCSIDKNGKLFELYGDINISKESSDIFICSDKLTINTEPVSNFSKTTYKRLFEGINNVISNKTIKEEKVYIYIGNYTGMWYEIDIKKDPNSKDRVLLVWFYSTYVEKFESNSLNELKIYKYLFDIIPYGMCIYIDNKIKFINQSAINFLGGSCWSDFIGRGFKEFISSTSDINIDDIAKKVCLNSKDVIYNEEIKTLNLEKFKVNMNISPIIFNGKKGVLLSFKSLEYVKDIEELENIVNRKKAEIDNTIKNEKMKIEFFADVSHELRTPLNVILGAIQLLSLQMDKGSIIDEEDKLSEYLSIVKFNALRLLRLVNNIIDFTKIDSGFNELDLKKCNIVSFVEEITNSVVPCTEGKGIELTFDTSEEEIFTLIDPSKMERVILNLLSNAIKFTPNGGDVFVNITFEENINISIKDTGIGMDSDKVKLIFERFKQVNNGYIKANEGSGIGLSLAKSIIEKHGGYIDVQSILGEGSEFTIVLPKDNIDIDAGEFSIYEFQLESIDLELSDICFQK